MRSSLIASLAVICAGCAIGEPRYPLAWGLLPTPPTEDCRSLQGNYADRGEMAIDPSKPSLTRELFGFKSDWKSATSVEFLMPVAEVLEITAWAGGKRMLTQSFNAAAGEFTCSAGHVKLSGKRWVAEEMITGQEEYSVDLYYADRHMLAFVATRTYATLFIFVPVIADATHWYRFARMNP